MQHLEVFTQKNENGKVQIFINYDFGGTKGIIPATDAKEVAPEFNTEEEAWQWLQGKERNGSRFLTPEEFDDPALQEEIFYKEFK